MINYNKDYYAVIMAGGIGSRFWPVSTAKFPKQFHDLFGTGETLLQRTFSRLNHVVPYENILILTNERYEDLVKEQLPKINEDQIILEPAMLNTAPCLLVAAMKIKKQNENAVMIVAPSDHWIKNENAFWSDVKKAFEKATEEDMLITLGIEPNYPNTGYGYIKYENSKEKEIYKVDQFTEKPTLRNAKKFLEEGNYAWNAGIFIWKASVLVEEFKKHQPEMYEHFKDGEKNFNTLKEREYIQNVYPSAKNISIDYAILENAKEVYVIPASFDWNDLGTWNSLHDELAVDDSKNAVVAAKLMIENAENNMVFTKNNKIVVLDGVSDFIIVEDNDVLMIVPREKEQDIKDIRQRAIEKFGNDFQ